MSLNQTLLQLKPSAQKTFERFYPADNETIVAHLRELAAPDTEKQTRIKQVYLWGDKAAGKTHLLQASCQTSNRSGLRSAYLPLSEVAAHGTQLLSGLENVNMLCLDDMDAVLSDVVWQEALFHLINAIHTNGGRLVMAGETNPLHLDLPFKDLQSRLVWGLVYGMQPLSEEDTYTALQTLVQDEDSGFTEEALRYLLNNYPRDLGHLTALIEQLEIRAKQTKRNRVTIPFIKEHLKGGMVSE